MVYFCLWSLLVFIKRGVDADGLDLEKIWSFNATAKAGDSVSSGDILGTVQETKTIEIAVFINLSTTCV